MRIAKVPDGVLKKRIWDSLCRRMDPATHRVTPSWLTLMRETEVCRQRIAGVIKDFMAWGWIKRVEIPREGGKRAVCRYELQMDRHDADVARPMA